MGYLLVKYLNGDVVVYLKHIQSLLIKHPVPYYSDENCPPRVVCIFQCWNYLTFFHSFSGFHYCFFYCIRKTIFMGKYRKKISFIPPA